MPQTLCTLVSKNIWSMLIEVLFLDVSREVYVLVFLGLKRGTICPTCYCRPPPSSLKSSQIDPAPSGETHQLQVRYWNQN